MLPRPFSIQDQPSTRHADEVALEKVNQPGRRIVFVHGTGKLPHGAKPLVKRDHVGAWDVERVCEDGDELWPGLPGWVFDMVDAVGWRVGEQQIA